MPDWIPICTALLMCSDCALSKYKLRCCWDVKLLQPTTNVYVTHSFSPLAHDITFWLSLYIIIHITGSKTQRRNDIWLWIRQISLMIWLAKIPAAPVVKQYPRLSWLGIVWDQLVSGPESLVDLVCCKWPNAQVVHSIQSTTIHKSNDKKGTGSKSPI